MELIQYSCDLCERNTSVINAAGSEFYFNGINKSDYDCSQLGGLHVSRYNNWKIAY